MVADVVAESSSSDCDPVSDPLSSRDGDRPRIRSSSSLGSALLDVASSPTMTSFACRRTVVSNRWSIRSHPHAASSRLDSIDCSCSGGPRHASAARGPRQGQQPRCWAASQHRHSYNTGPASLLRNVVVLFSASALFAFRAYSRLRMQTGSSEHETRNLITTVAVLVNGLLRKWISPCLVPFFYRHMPIGKVWIYRLLLFVCFRA